MGPTAVGPQASPTNKGERREPSHGRSWGLELNQRPHPMTRERREQGAPAPAWSNWLKAEPARTEGFCKAIRKASDRSIVRVAWPYPWILESTLDARPSNTPFGSAAATRVGAVGRPVVMAESILLHKRLLPRCNRAALHWLKTDRPRFPPENPDAFTGPDATGIPPCLMAGNEPFGGQNHASTAQASQTLTNSLSYLL